MARLVEPLDPLEPRRLFSLPDAFFSQANDAYSMAVTPVGQTAIAATPITSIAWGFSRTGLPQDFAVTLPAGPLSPRFFDLFMTERGISLVRIDQKDGPRLRARWDVSQSQQGPVNSRVTGFSQFIGADGVLYDSVAFQVPRMINSFFVPLPGGGDQEVRGDWNFATISGPVDPTVLQTGYMSTAPDVRSTIEFSAGQLPLSAYEFNPASLGSVATFTTVGGVDEVPLWRRAVRGTQLGEIVVTHRDDQARPVSRTRFGTSTRLSMLGAYSTFDTTLDSEARRSTFELLPTAAQVVGYTYTAGGAMNAPTSSGWDYSTNTSLNPAPVTAFIRAPTHGPRNTPLNSVNIQFSSPVPGLTAGHLWFEQLVAQGLTLNTADGGLNYTIGNLAPQQANDGDYGVKLFALGSGLASGGNLLIGSTGIKWTLDRVPPSVTAAAFEFESRQQLRFDFSEDVGGSLMAGDLTLHNLTTSTTVAPGAVALSYDGNSAVFTFPGLPGGILPDGRYRATLAAAGVTDAAGNALSADRVEEFEFLNGDANRDGRVDIGDFAAVAANFNRPGTFSAGDFDYSGTVEIGDFSILASKFNTALPGAVERPGRAPAAATPARAAVFSGRALDLIADLAAA